MAKFQVRRSKKITPRVKAWLAIFALSIVTIILGNATYNIYNKNKLALENKLSAVRELEDLKGRQQVIKDKLDWLKTPEGREDEIRKNLPMAKAGEYVITIVDYKDQQVSSDTESITATIKKGFWQSFVDIIMN